MSSIRDGLASGKPVDGLALVSAIWAHYCLGKTQDGTIISPNDPHWSDLQTAAQKAQTRPMAWLDQRQIYGDLKDARRLADAFALAYEKLRSEGLEKVIQNYAQGHGL